MKEAAEALQRSMANPPVWFRAMALVMFASFVYTTWADHGPRWGLLALVVWGVAFLPIAVAPRQWADRAKRRGPVEDSLLGALMMGGLAVLQPRLYPDLSPWFAWLVGALVVGMVFRVVVTRRQRGRGTEKEAAAPSQDGGPV